MSHGGGTEGMLRYESFGGTEGMLGYESRNDPWRFIPSQEAGIPVNPCPPEYSRTSELRTPQLRTV